MFKKNKKLTFFITKILPSIISAGILIYYCISGNNLNVLLKIFPSLNFFYLFLSFLSVILYLLFDSLVLSSLFGIYKNILKYFKLTMVSQFYSAITPFNSGGQPAQILELNKEGISAGKSISIISKKIFIYQLFSILFSSLSIIFYLNDFKNKIKGFNFIILIGFAMQFLPLLMIILLFLNKKNVLKLINMVYNVLQRFKIIKDAKKSSSKIIKQLTFLMNNNFSISCKWQVYFFSGLQHLFFILVPFFTAKAFGLSGFPVFKMLAAQVFIMLISNFSPLPGASGIAESCFIILLKDFFSSENIKPAMILNRFITYYFIIILSFIKFKKNKV